ncbi:helix-turn-helix transcriptional regulator [bacterium]|nr:helix-turn-helix transcriptional regulator [bacterium]
MRERRRDLGVSQAHLAELAGVRSTLVGAWERGEVALTRTQARAIGRALDFGPDEVDAVLAVSSDVLPAPAPVADIRVDLTAVPTIGHNGNGSGEGTVRLEILGESGDPWSDTPDPQIGSDIPDPQIGVVPATFTAPIRMLHQGATPPDLTALRMSATAIDLAEADRRHRQRERVQRRELDRNHRAAVRDEVAKRRQHALEAYRARVERERAEAASVPGPAYGLGAVFPMPDGGDEIERITYSTAEPSFGSNAADRLIYLSRRLRVILVLIAMGAALFWAVTELGDGWNALIDLFTGGGDEIVDEVVGAAFRLLG